MGSSNLDGFAAGSVEGTGAAIEVELRFTPRYVRLVNVDDPGVILEWDHTMANDTGHKMVIASGASAVAFVASGGVTPEELYTLETSGSYRGFQIGTDTDVNVSGETLKYYAWE